MPLTRQQRRARARDLRPQYASVLANGLTQTTDLGPTVALTFGLYEILCSPAPRRASDAAAAAARVFDRSLERHPPAALPGQTAACGKGCSYCCSNFVSASAPEVLSLAARLQAMAASPDAPIRRRLAEAARSSRDLRIVKRNTLTAPCPVLSSDGACSAYLERPLTCRGYASVSVEVCIRSLTEPVSIPSPKSYMFYRTRSTTALWAALKAAGLPYVSYDLSPALQRAIDSPEAEPRWLAGEDVFADIQTDPSCRPDVEAFLDNLIRLAALA